MISNEDITNYAYLVSARFEAINTQYLKLIATQVKEMGTINPSNLFRLNQMAKMSQNIEEINSLLAKEIGITIEELYKIYEASGMSVYTDTFDLFKAKGITPTAFNENTAIIGYINSVKQLTMGTFLNMANTTVLSTNYKNIIDLAIDTITTGQADYISVMRSQMTNLADEGISITYASGVKRRLDSAIRMNILEGVRKINEGVRDIAGEQFGADGYEISAHALCANDHIQIQGKQFAKGTNPVRVKGKIYQGYDTMNSELKRHIGTCNCKHTRFPVILGISTPAYSNSELSEFKNNSEQSVTLTTGYNSDGTPLTKNMTKYEATQYQRNLETEIRKAKDRYIVFDTLGDERGKRESKERINFLQKSYKRISNEANLTPKLDRTYVYGYSGKQQKPKSTNL